jgi:hypothetical protein
MRDNARGTTGFHYKALVLLGLSDSGRRNGSVNCALDLRSFPDGFNSMPAASLPECGGFFLRGAAIPPGFAVGTTGALRFGQDGLTLSGLF